MQINSSTLNAADLDYFRKNFIVKSSNVSSLEEADIILLGENHACQEHRIKQCWLINKLAKENDTVFLETSKTKLSRSIFEVNLGYTTSTNLQFKGWDSRVGREIDTSFYSFSLKVLSKIGSLLNATNMDAHTMHQGIKELASIFIKNEEVILAMIKISKSLDSAKDRSILEFPKVIKKWKKLLKIFSETITSENQLKERFLFILFASMTTLVDLMVFEHSLITFLRNVHLTKQITQFVKPSNKAFIIAGSGHLWNDQDAPRSGVKESIEKIHEGLKSKNFVILGATDSREQIEHAEGFLKKFKIHDNFLTKHFRAFRNSSKSFLLATVSAIAQLSLAIFCDSKKANQMFLILSFGSLLLLVIDEIGNRLHPKEIGYEICSEIQNHHLKLLKLLSKKLQSAPKELIDSISSQLEGFLNV